MKLTLAGPATSASHPQASVEKGISLVSRFQFDRNPKLILVRGQSICDRGIVETLKDILRARAPSPRLCFDEGRRIVVGLQQIVGVDARGKVFDY